MFDLIEATPQGNVFIKRLFGSVPREEEIIHLGDQSYKVVVVAHRYDPNTGGKIETEVFVGKV